MFNTEPSLISVYDNTQLRFVTFEVYGLDTQSMLKLTYEYAAYDSLFRFNAELMNPNRKEGRFHWTIERLVIDTGGNNRKLKLGDKPTEEVAQMPTYETVRKIPTGRMDLKERQRLREQMDILDIRRAENIARKRAETKERILRHIFFLKEDFKRRKEEQAERMEAERALRFKRKEDEERKEEEALKILETKNRLRRKAIDQVMTRNEEQEVFELQELRARWQISDSEKARTIKDALDRRMRIKNDEKSAEEAIKKRRSDAAVKRFGVWKARDTRQKQREDSWLQKMIDGKNEAARNAKMVKERKQDYLKEWHSVRQPVFEAALARMEERAVALLAEQEAVNAYNQARAVPKKQKGRGKNVDMKSGEEKKPDETSSKKKKDDKKSGDKKEKKDEKKEDKKKDEDEPPVKSDKKDMEKVLDSVENKMRQQMEEARRRARMEKIREEKIVALDKERRMKELKHLSDVREAHRKAEVEEQKLFQERIIVMREKDAELQASKTRKQQERERLDRARQAAIARKDDLWMKKQVGGS